MSFLNYAGLQAEIASFLFDRTDLTAEIPSFIRLAEATANRSLREPMMSTVATVSVTGGRGTLPADYIEPILVTASGVPLEQVSPQQITSLKRYRMMTGNPRYYSVDGQYLDTAAPATVDVVLTYYRTIPYLSDVVTSNWLLDKMPDFYLYASLVQAGIYLYDAEMTDRYMNLLQAIIGSEDASSQQARLDAPREAGRTLAPVK